MKNCLLFVLFSLMVIALKAQFNETIRTDRPGQGVGPFTVGKHVFQTQTGFDMGGFNERDLNFSGLSFAPNTVLRFGLTNHLEINTAFEYRHDGYKLDDSTFSTNGFSSGSIGAGINLYEGDKSFPAVGLQVAFKLPVLSSSYNFNYIAPKIFLTASQDLNDKISILLNLGVNYNGIDAKPSGIYVFNIGFGISPRCGTFIENYGNFTNNNFENRWDSGIAYLLNDNLLIDIYGGAGYNNGILDYFTSIGISWRIQSSQNK